ncbi:MAG TPA: DoxX family protein [Gemmatimonadales bacterium]|nr:DoxX family protein [Gemmatimonadales bacterium]
MADEATTAGAATPEAPRLGERTTSLRGATHAVLRIGAGLLFMQHGAQKLFGAFGGMGPNGGTVQLFSQFGLAGVFEFFGGLLIVLGLLTRPVAVILLCEMLVAFFQAHLPRGGFPIQNGGELALLYALVWAFLAGHGAGPASVDGALAAKDR